MRIDETQVQEAVQAVSATLCESAEIGVVLGSGLGTLADQVENAALLPYAEIPHFVESSVHGHAGRLVAGTISGKRVIIQQGRAHLYEGYSFEQMLLPLRVMRTLGMQTLIVTNAAGGLNPDFGPGDLMLITDHINMMGTNPLIGPNNDALGPRFPDMSNAYDPALRLRALDAARETGIELKQGVYLAVTGPSYETPAEVRAFRALGASAIGMSTVPEAIYANYLGMRVLGLSVIANLAVGLTPQELTHGDVTRTVAAQADRIAALLAAVIAKA